MQEVLSLGVALFIIAELAFFGFAVIFDVACRVRSRLCSPKMQLTRAGLGHYPTWRA